MGSHTSVKAQVPRFDARQTHPVYKARSEEGLCTVVSIKQRKTFTVNKEKIVLNIKNPHHDVSRLLR
jgi:hypothetical protein